MLKYFYDKEADVFYFSQGVPSARDEVVEATDDVILRLNRQSGAVRGFTLLNASRRHMGISHSVNLPFTLVPTNS